MRSKVDPASSQAQFTFDLNEQQIFNRNAQNYINEVSVDQLNTLADTSILEIHLSKGYIVEPHYHQDSTELIYCIRGGVTVAMMNPSTKKLHSYSIRTNQVVNVPQGWWHYIVSDADDTQILGIFDAAKPQVILNSDILNVTPPEIMAKTYCVDEQLWKEAIAPIPPSVFIGPPRKCQPKERNQPKKSQREEWSPYSYRR